MKKKIVGIFVCTLLIIATVIPVAGYIKKESSSPLFAINTSVNSISPYNIPSSPLTITAIGPSDLDRVTLYYRWSIDNITWSGLQEFSIYEGFESGSQNTSLWNIYQTGGDARIQFNYGTAHSGSYSCAMDDFDSNQFDSALNVIYTKYDFTDAKNININFWEREWGDEPNNAPNSWSGWGNYDTVAFTNDGSTWYQIISESELNTQSYKQFEYNISEHTDFSSPPTSSFAIAFQQYDNTQLMNDGRAWDDIYIEYVIGSPSVNWSYWPSTSNPDISYPWSWNFNFPNSTGYYEFYSIGEKIGQDVETPPLVADARCRFNRMPEIFDENPSNGSIDVLLYPQLDISISDDDGETMDLIWYSNSSGTWKAFGSNTNVEDGTYSKTNDNFSKFDTTYWWYVTVTDDIYMVYSPIFHFTTEENSPPNTPSNPDPPNGATDVSINKILKWTGGDPNYGDKATYDVYFGKSSPPPLVAENILNTAYDPGTMGLETTYYWQIIAEDSGGLKANGPIWSFTTEKEPNYPPTRPDIYGSPRGPPGVELCWAFVSDDPDKNQLKYFIEWGDDNSEETDYYPEGMAVEACHTYENEGQYLIKIKAEDEKGLLSEESKFTIIVQKSRTVFHSLLLRLLERFPILERLLEFIRAV